MHTYDTTTQTYKEQVDIDRQIIAGKDSQIVSLNERIFDLQQELLISNGIIKQIPEKLDSIAKSNRKK